MLSHQMIIIQIHGPKTAERVSAESIYFKGVFKALRQQLKITLKGDQRYSDGVWPKMNHLWFTFARPFNKTVRWSNGLEKYPMITVIISFNTFGLHFAPLYVTPSKLDDYQ